MVINDPAVASTQLLGLGLKVYPSNMPRMLNKDLTRFILDQRLCRQGVRPIARMSNENADVPDVINSKMDVSLDGTLLSHTANLNVLF